MKGNQVIVTVVKIMAIVFLFLASNIEYRKLIEDSVIPNITVSPTQEPTHLQELVSIMNDLDRQFSSLESWIHLAEMNPPLFKSENWRNQAAQRLSFIQMDFMAIEAFNMGQIPAIDNARMEFAKVQYLTGKKTVTEKDWANARGLIKRAIGYLGQ